MRVRADISKKHKYYIPKHRYYELKHFCLQYPEWKKELMSVDGYSKSRIDICKGSGVSNPTERAYEQGEPYRTRINLIKDTAKNTDEYLWFYILKGVTEDLSYDVLNARERIPCSKETYYNLYRKFFRLLDLARG